MVYKWNGYSLPVKAEVVGKELEKLEKEFGCIKPEFIVEKAKPENSILHPLFEWDNEKAAESYRVDQARYIIRMLVIVDDSNKNEVLYRAFVNVSDKREKGVFINISDAMLNQETRKIVLKTALHELISFEAKYRKYTEFNNLFTEIESLKEILK